jgi:hypothetical protein
MKSVEVAYILGAGLSTYAGLPLQSEFTAALLEGRDYSRGPSKTLVDFLSAFIHGAFDHSETAGAKFWPELEDIFTCIDLSANTGHHLGEEYSPSDLRTIRRALISRISRMLQRQYEVSSNRKDVKWNQLTQLFDAIEPERSAFVVMNWDTVAEAHLERRCGGPVNFNYTGDSIAADFPSTGDRIVERDTKPSTRVRVIKMHGSVDCCDNCRRLFWFPPADVVKVANQAVSDAEWRSIRRAVGGPLYTGSKWKCPRCENVRLGGRIATFSYRKSLDFPMFQKSWFQAESVLRQARTWVFIGYSLPSADYEFKYFLKRIQLSQRPLPEYMLVAYGGKGTDNPTYRNYERFFGRGIKVGKNCFLDGINKRVVAQIEKLYGP